jgi:hypothetical protein
VFSSRISGAPLHIDPTTWNTASRYQKEELLKKPLARIVAMMNGASFNRDHVSISRPEGASVWCADGPTTFKLDEKEIRYWGVSMLERRM